MIIIKNKSAINKMRIAGRLLARIMSDVLKMMKPGTDTLEIDNFIEKEMVSAGLKPECKGYSGYKYATCISLNDVVIHGIPSRDSILSVGDLVKIDVVGSYENYCVDMTRCFLVGKVSAKIKSLVDVVQGALDAGIEEIAPGKNLSNISSRIQEAVEKEGFGVVRDFAGHGIGKSMHEDPEIPNYGSPGSGPVLQVGMTFAIEPMVTEGSYKVRVDKDGWTVRTLDGGVAGHIEDTVLVTDDGSEVLTRVQSNTKKVSF